MKRLLLIFFLFSPALLWAQNPELVVQTGHAGMITGMTASNDGRYLASISGTDHTIVVWETKTGKQFRTIPTNYQGMANIVFAPDSRHIWGLSNGDTLTQWNIFTGQKTRKLPPNSIGYTYALDVSPDGKYLITAAVGMALYDVEQGKEIKMVRTPYLIQAVEYSPDGKYIATSGVTPDGKLFDASTLEEKATFKGLPTVNSSAKTMNFSSDGKYFLSNSGDAVMMWEVATGKSVKKYDAKGVYSFALSPDNKKIFISTLSTDGTGISTYDATSGKKLNYIPNRVGKLLYSPDGSYLASAEMQASGFGIAIIDPETGNTFHNLKGYFYTIHTSGFTPGHPWLLTGGMALTKDNPLKIWDLTMGNMRSIDMPRNPIIKELVTSADGKTVAFAAYDSSVHILQTPSFQEIKKIRLHQHWAQAVSLVPGTNQFLSGSFNNELKQGDAESGKSQKNFAGHTNGVYSIAVHPDGKHFVSGSVAEIIAWDMQGNEVGKLQPIAFPYLRFSPDGKILASGEGNGLKLYSWPGLEMMHELDKPSSHQNSIRDYYYSSIAFHPSGKIIAGGTMDGTVKIWGTDGVMKNKMKEHTQTVNSVSFTADGKILATAGQDGKVILWDTQTWKQIATLVAIGSEDFVIVTPDNYYMATKGGLNGVAFRYGNKLFPFEQFDLQYNRPDIVLQRLGYADQKLIDAYKKAHEKRLKKMNFRQGEVGGEFHMPEIHLLSKELASITDQEDYSFKVKASDSKYKINRINVYVNDVPVLGSNGIDVSGKGMQNLEQEIKLKLSSGTNKIQVSCMNEKGAESLTETMLVNYKGGKTKPDLYVLAIGVSDYKDSRFDLNFAAKDAGDITAMMGTNTGAFGQIHQKTLVNEEATAENILAARDFLAQSHIDDIVVVFVAGHGLLDENLNYYYGTHNINFDAPAQGGLAYETLETVLDGIPARKKLLIMDTCHSGEVDEESVEIAEAENVESGEVTFRSAGNGVRTKEGFGLDNSFELMKFMFADLRKGTGATVISSAGGAEYAMEGSQWKNGVFTYSLLSGLKEKKADLDRNGIVTVTELQTYVRDQVKTLTGGKQVPTFRTENIANDFRVW